MEKYFFEIPIFRCSLDRWTEEQDKEELKLAEQIKLGETVSEQDLKNAKRWLMPHFSSYRYSEMVGMIRLFTMPGQIRAEIYFVKNKRLVRGQRNKKWRQVGKLFEFFVSPEMSNEEIYNWIIIKLRRESKTSLFKKRYVDLESFETVGPHINYHVLANLE